MDFVHLGLCVLRVQLLQFLALSEHTMKVTATMLKLSVPSVLLITTAINKDLTGEILIQGFAVQNIFAMVVLLTLLQLTV